MRTRRVKARAGEWLDNSHGAGTRGKAHLHPEGEKLAPGDYLYTASGARRCAAALTDDWFALVLPAFPKYR